MIHPLIDHYSALKVPPYASTIQITLVYRSCALKYHLDKRTAQEDKEKNVSKFHAIQEAYEVLSPIPNEGGYDIQYSLHFVVATKPVTKQTTEQPSNDNVCAGYPHSFEGKKLKHGAFMAQPRILNEKIYTSHAVQTQSHTEEIERRFLFTRTPKLRNGPISRQIAPRIRRYAFPKLRFDLSSRIDSGSLDKVQG
jgi:curved DNA-binding protein CbpA